MEDWCFEVRAHCHDNWFPSNWVVSISLMSVSPTSPSSPLAHTCTSHTCTTHTHGHWVRSLNVSVWLTSNLPIFWDEFDAERTRELLERERLCVCAVNVYTVDDDATILYGRAALPAPLTCVNIVYVAGCIYGHGALEIGGSHEWQRTNFLSF